MCPDSCIKGLNNYYSVLDPHWFQCGSVSRVLIKIGKILQLNEVQIFLGTLQFV
jgi:hypothetical protein